MSTVGPKKSGFLAMRPGDLGARGDEQEPPDSEGRSMFQAARLGGESPGQEEADKEGQKGQRGRGQPDDEPQCGGLPDHVKQACFGQVGPEVSVNPSWTGQLEAGNEDQYWGTRSGLDAIIRSLGQSLPTATRRLSRWNPI